MMVSSRLLISTSFSLRTSPLVTVPRAPITIGITVSSCSIVFFSIPQQVPGSYLSVLLCAQPERQILLCRQPGRQIIIIIYSFWVFHISVSWWFFTGVWVTASLFKSPGLVSGFWPFLAILSLGQLLLVRQLPSAPGLLIIL